MNHFSKHLKMRQTRSEGKILQHFQARKKVTVEQMVKEREQSRKMKEYGKCILLSKYLGEGRHFCYCTFKKTIFRRVCMVFRQKLFPGSKKESIHLGKSKIYLTKNASML